MKSEIPLAIRHPGCTAFKEELARPVHLAREDSDAPFPQPARRFPPSPGRETCRRPEDRCHRRSRPPLSPPDGWHSTPHPGHRGLLRPADRVVAAQVPRHHAGQRPRARRRDPTAREDPGRAGAARPDDRGLGDQHAGEEASPAPARPQPRHAAADRGGEEEALPSGDVEADADRNPPRGMASAGPSPRQGGAPRGGDESPHPKNHAPAPRTAGCRPADRRGDCRDDRPNGARSTGPRRPPAAVPWPPPRGTRESRDAAEAADPPR